MVGFGGHKAYDGIQTTSGLETLSNDRDSISNIDDVMYEVKGKSSIDLRVPNGQVRRLKDVWYVYCQEIIEL